MGPNPTRTGVLVGLPSPWRAPCWPASSSPPLYIQGRGALLAVCGAPSIVFDPDHIIVVLRRSPVPVTSSSQSPGHHADETLPQPQLDQEFEGRHRAESVHIAEVSCVRYLISWIAKTFDYINHITKRFRFWSTRVSGHTLPTRCYASPR